MPRASLTVLFLIVQLLVLVVGLAVMAVTTLLIGPQMYINELIREGRGSDIRAIFDLDNSFREVSLLAMSVGGLTSLVIAAVVSVLVTRQIRYSVSQVGDAANRIASGEFDIRLKPSKLGSEFDALVDSFNDMAAKLEAVDRTRRQMLADLAHEMRTPLASLKGHLEGIEDGIVPQDRHTAAILTAQINRLEHLAKDMRALTQAEEGMVHLQLRHHDPTDLVRDTIAAAEPTARARQVELSARVPGGTVSHVMVDRRRMDQVLSNLVENALRHTPAGGRVTVGLSEGTHEVSFTVSDTGEGIDAEDLSRIFMRFYRVGEGREGKPGGSGLGLAISKALVEAQGGALTASSAGPGQGAEFTVRMPRR
ncbi:MULTISPECIES: sensor histidine kinase [Citricoccus]|uniref:sensor histidine kinase n=1 Tax=Citricoccus TaxID=169133 RepID=UPI000255F03B|nr:HAMP domain-containing sensor histidine kinase [Citricoccus sp. CH26A]